MATDESSRAADSMWPTAQAAPGSMHSSREPAMSAPGSAPAMSDGADQPGPHVTAEPFAPSNRVDGDGGDQPGGASWEDVSGRREAWGPGG